jgi:hypothetical protein
MKRFALGLVTLATLVAGCGGPEAGTVYKKTIEPANSTYMMFMIPMSCGQNCTMNVPIMYWVEDDQDWVVSVKDAGETNDLYVTPEQYEKASVGEWFGPKKVATKDDYKKYDKKPS